MAYCLERVEPISTGIRRVVTEQVEFAIGIIEDDGASREIAVHEVRKSCKRIRAALRLVRDGFEDYRAENFRFRDLAGKISDARDLHVLPVTHWLVTGLLRQGSKRADLIEAATTLDEYFRGELQARGQTVGESLAQVCSGLESALRSVAAWNIGISDIDGPVSGLRNTYARSKAALERCIDNPSAASLHEWRKQAKYHGYHLQLLGDAWPEAREARGAASESLAGLLGEDQDFANYARALEEIRPTSSTASWEILVREVRRRREILHHESFAIGEALFSDDPDVLAARFRAHWRNWRAS